MIKKGLYKRFAEIGKIKIGGKGETRKSKDGKEYQLPVRYEHFVITKTEKGRDGNFIIDNDLTGKLCQDGKPKEIPIRLLFDSIDMNFHTSFQYYHGSKLICKGDGEKAERTGQNGVKSNVVCNPDECEFLKDQKCKVSGILSCQIAGNPDIGGIHRFRTHSWNSVSNILTALEFFSENTNGILQGLPLKLVIIKKATQEHGNVNVVTIVLDGIEFLEMRQKALAEYKGRMELGINMKKLEKDAKDAGFMEDKDDPEDISGEFYPPTIDTQPIDSGKGTTSEDLTEKIAEAQTPTEPQGTGEQAEPTSPGQKEFFN